MRLDQLRDDIGAHAVVDAAAGQDDLAGGSRSPRLVGQVVRIDADAVAADQAGRNGRKFHLVPAACQHLFGVDAHPVEDERQFVDQGDIDVALGVLDDLGGFGDLDAGGLVGAGGDDLAVERRRRGRRLPAWSRR